MKKKPRKLRVMQLMHADLVPPDSIEGLDEKQMQPFKTEFDVLETLRAELGHEVLPLGVDSDLGVLRRAIMDFKPHVTFNLLEEFHGVAVYDQHVVSYLELMRSRYTGCNPRGLMLAHDKALSKKVLAFHRVPVPDFAVYPLGQGIRPSKKLRYPMLVKSLTEEASLGIAQASLVQDAAQLKERAEFIHRQLGTDAIAERFIDGREFYVGVLGNYRLKVLPVWELVFKNVSDETPLIATAKVKWDPKYQEKLGVDYRQATGIDKELERRIHHICKRTYRLLNLSGYARIDLRMEEDGKLYVLEANPNPELQYGGEFADSAEVSGTPYSVLLQKILQLGLSYRAQWQE
ncbi:MAG: ATP-grasp domain-containing protein [Acidobacteriota bacterium]|nr:ATP-grasp domain-containing protein [Acidobacteriota bacterium]MDH3784238.1 ATP-grasp domain-containing protein [Acidobacteriota bacterium]